MLHHIESGAGPAVVLLHAFPMDSALWAGQRRALAAAGYRVVAADLPGFGGSAVPAEPPSLDVMADAVAYQEAHNKGHLDDRFEYGRYGNPTIAAAEARIAALEHPETAILVASGIAALAYTFLQTLPAGRVPDRTYPISRLASAISPLASPWAASASPTGIEAVGLLIRVCRNTP